MSVKERREREKEQLRELILQAARDLFLEEGYDRVTVRKIAERIEYAPGTIYLYFEDKDQIFLEICEANFAGLVERLRELSNTGDPVEQIREGLRAYIRYGIENPRAYEVLFVMKTRVANERRHREGGKGGEAMQYLVSGVVEGQRRGMVRQGEPKEIALALWAAAHGITHLIIDQELGQTPECQGVVEMLLDIQIAGLRP